MMFGFDWNGNGVRDGFDSFMDFMVISEMEKEDEDGEKDEDDEASQYAPPQSRAW